MGQQDVFGHIDVHLDESLATLSEFCKIPSISAEKRAQPEAAAFVRKLLGEVGIDAREVPTEGGPSVVFGEYRAGAGRPTLLFYNHYDVQPVDSLEEWKTNPFNPVIRDGKMFARGSGDTKGNLVAQVAALRAFLAAGDPVPCNVKFVVEGEEEVGSPHFRSFVEANRGILKADGATIEGGEHTMHGVPKVEFGCKGTLYLELTARTAALDQHSMWAPILPNAAWRLIHALDTMRDRDCRVLPGMKTAKQLAVLKRHLKAKGFGDIDVHFHDALEASATPYDTRIAKACVVAAKDVYRRPPAVWPWSLGASATGFFNEIVGVPSVSGPGVSYEASGYHAPNEHIRIDDFRNGAKYFAALMARF